MNRLSFGTYKKSGEMLTLALQQAIGEARNQIFLIDTAMKYGNQMDIATALKDSEVRIGSKVNRVGKVAEDLSELQGLFGSSLYRVLLHKPMTLDDWAVLEKARREGLVCEIGVSNYSAEKLEELLVQCEVPPDVVQNELHACIATAVPEICRKHGIRFEAHSVMAANKHLQPMATRKNATPSQVAIAYCLAKGADVCFSTANLCHLRQDVGPELHSLLTPEDVEELSLLAFKHPVRLYRHQGSLASDAQALYRQLQEDAAAFAKGLPFSETCVGVPKTYRDNTGLSKLLADWIFPETSTPARWQKFDGLLYRMRKATEERLEKIRAEKRAAFPKVCALPDMAVLYPDALPVNIPSATEFRDFLEELKVLPSPDQSAYPKKMGKGVLFPDGRMDLCKQVIQPCFEELCNTVAATGRIRHFLLGNNVVFRDGSTEEISARRDALVDLLQTDPGIETWYLAGNGIDEDLSASLANGFKAASHMKALWLKMNPVKTGAFHFGELAGVHCGLELLDLFNTGLGDDGIQAFRDGLASHGGSSTLRHLYLSINGISDGAAVADIVRLLPNLESLFLGVNFLRDEGACLVLEALKGHRTLCRLEFGANGMTDASLPHLLEVVRSAPKLRAVKLGSYKSTNYFGGKHNEFTSALGLVDLAQNLAYLNIDGGVENVDFDALEDGLKNIASACYVEASQGPVGMKRTLQTGEGDPSACKSALHPQPFVDHIQSIYRNQM